MPYKGFLKFRNVLVPFVKIRRFHRQHCLQCQDKNPKPPQFARCAERVFSGIQPTGVPHLGNYMSAINNWVHMQQQYDSMIVSIVDLHSITMPQDPAILRENIQVMAACLIACGINPDKTILFQQSMVSYHSELSWILGCLCTLPRLEHLPQWRDKCQTMKEPRVGLFTYPILQAADILLYKSTTVPVGEDQITHLELAKDLAKAFNRTYGLVFPACNPHIGDVAKVKSLKNPEVKMSKSDPNPISRIDLSDTAEEVQQKLKKATTDSVSKEITFDPENRLGLANLIEIHASLTSSTPEEIVNNVQLKGLSKKDYKNLLADVINSKIQPIRMEMDRLLSDRGHLSSVLEQGAERASTIAESTMKQVKKVVGFQ